MTPPIPTDYDRVPYPSLAHNQTHPDRMATVAALLGFKAAPIQRCRVLELGCGDGTNLIAMAAGLPGSEFLGIDSAARPIAEGQRMIADLGLANIRLEERDLVKFGEDGGSFDYIIAHGLYSWVPEPIRDRILALCCAHLAPQGIAYVSYNTYPGSHLRDMVRRMMLFHIRDIDGAAERDTAARSLVRFLATSKNEPDPYRLILAQELERVEERSAGALHHDDLNPFNHPVYFHEFVAHAASHGLQFLSEATVSGFDPSEFTPAVLAALGELDEDPIARGQYLDFLTCRRFRCSLLCRREIALDHSFRPDAITELFAASNAEPVSSHPDLPSSAPEVFRASSGAAITTNRPLQKAALWHLNQRWPTPILFTELWTAARDLSASGVGNAEDEREGIKALSELLLRTYVARVVDLHVWAPPMLAAVSERPKASPIARLESRLRSRVTTLRHTGLELTDPMSRHLLGLLDGTRDFAALAAEMTAFAQANKIEILRDEKPLTDPAEIHTEVERMLPAALNVFARGAVLVG